MVQVRVDLEALRRGSVGDGETCEIPGVGPVPVRTARELFGDAWVDLVISDGVDVTTICRMGRSIPTPLRTAITERDRQLCGSGLRCRQRARVRPLADRLRGRRAPFDGELARVCRLPPLPADPSRFVLSGGPGKWCFDPPSTQSRAEQTETQENQAD